MIAKQEQETGVPYDYVSIFRSDMKWQGNHVPVNLTQVAAARGTRACWIGHKRQDFLGITDFDAFCTRDASRVYLKGKRGRADDDKGRWC